MTNRKSKGDLIQLDVTEHIDNPKRYALIGHFKGEEKTLILARIGEGDDDPRPAKDIKFIADCLAEELIRLYTYNARLRADERRRKRNAP